MCKIVAYSVDGASVECCFTCKLKPLKPPLALIWQRSHTSQQHPPPHDTGTWAMEAVWGPEWVCKGAMSAVRAMRSDFIGVKYAAY